MEQIDTYIPDQGRTLEELCQDINLRAETVYLKFSKKEKNSLLIAALVLIGFFALTWYFQWFEIDWHMGSIWIGVLVVYAFVVYSVNKVLINAMKHAASPKQHLRMAKCLKWWVKLYRAIGTLFVIWAPLLRLLVEGQKYDTVLLIVGPLLLFCFLGAPIDSEYNDGLTELEYRLEE